jgi:glycosyltransferase involved in cell wall biosynthesis
MKKILAFCFFPAFTPPSNGGQSRLFNFYKSLSRYQKITLLTSTHLSVDEERVYHGVNFVERRIPKDHYFAEQWGLLEPYSSGGDLSAPALVAASRFATLLHQAYLDEYDDADVIIHDSPFTEGYDLFKGIDSKVRVYNAYNCEAQLYRMLHPGEKSKPIQDLICQSEKTLLASADLVLYCSESDLTAFREFAPNAKFAAHFAPNGMSLQPASKAATHEKGARQHAVFMGSGHPPNVSAARFIVEELAPRLPDVCFQIIGTCLPEGRYPSNVIRLGTVSEEKKLELLQSAALALNPMSDGSGSNVKVLDYFSHSLPVLSTPFGMRGIDAEPDRDFIETTLDEFSLVLKSIWSDRERLRSIGKAGQRLAAEHYTWDAIAKGAGDKIAELCKAKSLAHPDRYVLVLNDYDSFASVGGGSTRTRGLYAAVAEWNQVVFVCFSSKGELATRRHADGILVITVPKSQAHEKELHRINSSFHIACDDIVSCQYCLQEDLLGTVYRALRKNARAIVVEHCYLAPLPLDYGDRFVYSSQNIEAKLKAQLLQWHPLRKELMATVEHIERQAVECAAAIVAVSDEDALGLLRGKRTAGPTIVVRNGADVPPPGELLAPELAKLRKEIYQRSVLFLGSAHMPNVESANIIVDRIAPACPDIEFHLIGSVCNTLHAPIPTNVRLWGILDENAKCAVMQSCSIAINPMVSGGGSNIKLADYIGNGLFVVTTEFGQRGYPASINSHIAVAAIEDFPRAIKDALSRADWLAPEVREARQLFFREQLSMKSLGGGFVALLNDLESPTKRVLFVTYRYTAPAMGGAESMIEHLIGALGSDGGFTVDVVAPEVSHIENHWRFHEDYQFDTNTGVFINFRNVRFARFPVTKQGKGKIAERLEDAWRVQPFFERTVSQLVEAGYEDSGLTWGWGYPESGVESTNRWAMASCGLHVAGQGLVAIKGTAPFPAFVTIRDNQQAVLASAAVDGEFWLEFTVEYSGTIELETSVSQMAATYDPRPLAFFVTDLRLAGVTIDLGLPTLIERALQTQGAARIFETLHEAAENTRSSLNVRLTDGRGPWSDGLERYIAENAARYDLVITHNNVFRPAIVAIEEAKRNGVPVILIPHAHLDDDYYHFPDLLESARNADLVLAAPNAACDFFAARGCNVQYLPAGVDTTEVFSGGDVNAFRRVWPLEKPFVLVLGRKAGAKAYRKVISAAEGINQAGGEMHVVLIGPDDDGIPVDSAYATYLGRQPREVVRGALKACLAVVSMSVSESFGIVLLEAWLAGRPVIVNKACAAFHDLAAEGESAMMVDDTMLKDAIIRLRDDPALAHSLAENGRQIAQRYDWAAITRRFVNICAEMTNLCSSESASILIKGNK